ncbi:MAG TPA: isochorismatase family cysteine hydrolase [Casimicrobiaceae bacterium]|nr:isochorismatase family cysteine hydrolase [Casimicrobiaceae bacterium]
MARASTVLLLVDFLNFMDFPTARSLAPHAIRAARAAKALKLRLARQHVPAIYANDNFGHWESDIHAVVDTCIERGGASRELAQLMAPQRDDRSVLKPRHSAFFGTPLEFILAEMGVRRLIIAGLTTDSCVMFTAHDAYLRDYAIWVPSDCVASARPAHTRQALSHMQRVLKAKVAPSTTSLTSVFASRTRASQ